MLSVRADVDVKCICRLCSCINYHGVCAKSTFIISGCVVVYKYVYMLRRCKVYLQDVVYLSYVYLYMARVSMCIFWGVIV